MKKSGYKTRAEFDRYNIVSAADLKPAVREIGKFPEIATKTTTIDEISDTDLTASQAQVIKITN